MVSWASLSQHIMQSNWYGIAMLEKRGGQNMHGLPAPATMNSVP